MRLTAELLAVEIIDKDEEEKELTIQLACEGFDNEKLELKIGDKKYELDAGDLMEAIARISVGALTDKKEN